MNRTTPPALDAFPIGCMVSVTKDETDERVITYTNRYMQDELGVVAEMIGQPLASIFSKASKIIFDTYVLPMLIHEGRCVEIIMDLQQTAGRKIPVSVNAHLGDDDTIYWTLSVADKQKNLHRKLLETRDQLENKARLLQQQSITDELTGLINRRELKRQAISLMAQSERANWPISLIMLDIDYFKRINDSLGHDAGDETLVELSRLLKKVARGSDVVARFGGEEFIILMPDTDVAAATVFTERLHQAVKQTKIHGNTLTVSVGIATADSAQKKPDFHTFTKQADEAMYQAKSQGRNTTCAYEGPPAEIIRHQGPESLHHVETNKAEE